MQRGEASVHLPYNEVIGGAYTGEQVWHSGITLVPYCYKESLQNHLPPPLHLLTCSSPAHLQFTCCEQVWYNEVIGGAPRLAPGITLVSLWYHPGTVVVQ